MPVICPHCQWHHPSVDEADTGGENLTCENCAQEFPRLSLPHDWADPEEKW